MTTRASVSRGKFRKQQQKNHGKRGSTTIARCASACREIRCSSTPSEQPGGKGHFTSDSRLRVGDAAAQVTARDVDEDVDWVLSFRCGSRVVPCVRSTVATSRAGTATTCSGKGICTSWAMAVWIGHRPPESAAATVVGAVLLTVWETASAPRATAITSCTANPAGHSVPAFRGRA